MEENRIAASAHSGDQFLRHDTFRPVVLFRNSSTFMLRRLLAESYYVGFWVCNFKLDFLFCFFVHMVTKRNLYTIPLKESRTRKCNRLIINE